MKLFAAEKKQDYLEALHQADMNVGKVPSDGAHATVTDIAPFLQYFQGIVANDAIPSLIDHRGDKRFAGHQHNCSPQTYCAAFGQELCREES